MPWAWYADADVLRREGERIFARSWQYAGHLGQIGETGGFFAATAGQIPVVVTRARDGELRAFLNVCRHRGHVVASGSGERETLQCPYHAWTYGLDGRLRAAPRSDREPGFDTDELGLKQIAVAPGARWSSSTRDPEGRLPSRGARRRTCPARGDHRHRFARVPFPRPSSRSPRTGRSAARTSSSATTAPSRIPGFSAARSTSRPTPIGSQRLGSFRARSGRYAPERQLVSHRRRGATEPVPLPLAELRAQRLPGPAEPLVRADVPARA